MADTLSQFTTCLEPEAVQAILDGATMGTSQRAEGENQTIIESDQQLEQEVQATAGQVLVEMHVTNWAVAQKEDPELDAVLQWLESKKKTDLRTLLGECIMSEEARWCGETARTALTSEVPSICTPTPKGRMRICYYLLYPKCTKLQP